MTCALWSGAEERASGGQQHRHRAERTDSGSHLLPADGTPGLADVAHSARNAVDDGRLLVVGAQQTSLAGDVAGNGLAVEQRRVLNTAHTADVGVQAED